MRRLLAESGLQVSSIGSPIGKIKIDGRLRVRTSDRMRHAADVANLLRARPFVRIFSFFVAPGDDPDASPRRGAAADAGPGRCRRAGGRRAAAREREGDLRRRAAPLPRHRRAAVGFAAPAAGLGPGELRPGRGRAARSTRATRCCAPTSSTCRSRTPSPPTRAWSWRAPVTARWSRPMRALRDDGFDGFFSLEPHLALAGTLGGFSGEPSCSPTAWRAFTDLLTARRDRVRMSSDVSTTAARRVRLALVGAGVIGKSPRARGAPTSTTGSSWSRWSTSIRNARRAARARSTAGGRTPRWRRRSPTSRTSAW